jgi:hypothetical protein
MKRHPELVAAVLNGVLCLSLPFLFLTARHYLIGNSSNSSVTVSARDPSVSDMTRFLRLAQPILVLLPFAMLAAWRTWVHAKQWGQGRGAGWRGVAEAGACGLAVALANMAPGILARPAEAPPYILVYGGFATVLGLLVGLILRAAALFWLRLLHGPPTVARG